MMRVEFVVGQETMYVMVEVSLWKRPWTLGLDDDCDMMLGNAVVLFFEWIDFLL